MASTCRSCQNCRLSFSNICKWTTAQHTAICTLARVTLQCAREGTIAQVEAHPPKMTHLARSRMALSTQAPSSFVIILSPKTLPHSWTQRAAKYPAGVATSLPKLPAPAVADRSKRLRSASSSPWNTCIGKKQEKHPIKYLDLVLILIAQNSSMTRQRRLPTAE